MNKDGVKVAVLTFTKCAFRLGETVCGVVELNDLTGRARVLQVCFSSPQPSHTVFYHVFLQLSAILEAHETLPSTISSPSTARHLRRVHAEHYSSFTLNTLRTTFCLDIPSDASPAFQICIGTSSRAYGGLEWKVRLCLLVAVAAETSDLGTEGVRMKTLIRDGPRGEWGSSWRAPDHIAPLEKPDRALEQQQQQQKTKSWAEFLASPLLLLSTSNERAYHDGDEYVLDGEEGGVGGGGEGGYDGIKPDLAGGVGVGVDYGGGEEGWREVKLETVECEVPIKVWPGNTAFKAMDVVFDV